jgi:hypothetical protein
MKWDDIAKTFDMRRCAGCQTGDHLEGWASRDVIHWADRRMSKSGLRHFLMLIGSQRLLDVDSMPPWQRIYTLNTWASAIALSKYHVRLPLDLSAVDRSRVRWFATKDPSIPAKVRRWAYRRKHP